MITLQDLGPRLRPGLNAIEDSYNSYKGIWEQIFTKHKSNKNYEEDLEMKMLGYGQVMGQGEQWKEDNMGARTITRYINQRVGIGFAITKDAIEDDLYEDKFAQGAASIVDSLQQTKNLLMAAFINLGFDANAPIGDGQPLFSVNHPTQNGVFANTLSVNSDFSETAVESVIKLMRRWTDYAGVLRQYQSRKLVVGVDNEFAARRFMESAYRPGTNLNDKNVLSGLFPEGIVVNPFLTQPGFWGVLTDVKEMKYFQRMPLETNMYSDPRTFDLSIFGSERYCGGCSNARSFIGCKSG